jgi:hypothetical protein
MKTDNEKVIQEFVKLQEQIPAMLENFLQSQGTKKIFIARKANMPYNTFWRKLRNPKSLTPDETLNLVKILEA